MLTLILVTTLIVLSSLFYFYKKQFNYWKNKGVPQTNPALIFGDNYDTFIKGVPIDEFTMKIYNELPDSRYLGFYQFHSPMIMIKDPELIKQMCVKDFDYFTDHMRFMPEDVDPMWNKNLLSLKGQKWREMRATLSPSFTGSKMRIMFTLMYTCAENFVKHFNENNENLIEVNLKDAFTRYTNDIIATTAFGIQCDSLRDRDNEFYKMGRETTNLNGSYFKTMKFFMAMFFPFTAKYLKVSIFNEEITTFFRNIIKDTIDYRTKNKIERPDMLHLLLQARREEENEIEQSDNDESNDHHKNLQKRKLDLSLDDITSQALIFFFAGFETVSSAMCFLAYELAINPDIQQRLIRELDEYRKNNKTPTYEGLNQLTYFDMVVSETLRKWPITMATDRLCIKPYTIKAEKPEENPVNLVPGDVLSIPFLGLHRDPKYWENPDKFNPERFSPDNKSKIVPYTYLPFGVGPRNCIGFRFALIEVKVVFYALLEKYEIVPIAKSRIPYKTEKRAFTFTTEGFWFGFKKRESHV